MLRVFSGTKDKGQRSNVACFLFIGYSQVKFLALICLLSFGFADTVSLQADYLKYIQDKAIIASGNVQLFHQQITLNADQVILYTKENYFFAEGNVSANHEGRHFHANSLTYRIDYNSLSFDDFSAVISIEESRDPIHFRSDSIKKKGGIYYGNDSSFSTCSKPNKHYEIDAKRFVLHPRERIQAWEVYAHAGDIPVFYSPYYEFALGYRNPIYLMPVIGNSKVEGFFVKSTLDYHLNQNLQNLILLDYIEKKGWGYGLKTQINKYSKSPLEVYSYRVNDKIYNFSLQQKYKFNAKEFLSYYQNRRSMYKIFGGNDDFMEYQIRYASAFGDASFYNKTDYLSQSFSQQYSWSSSTKTIKQQATFKQDDYVRSETTFQQGSYSYTSLNDKHSLYYNKSNYRLSNSYSERIDHKYSGVLNQMWSMSWNARYTKQENNNIADLEFQPGISFTYSADRDQLLRRANFKKIEINADRKIDLDGDIVTSDSLTDLRENTFELNTSFYPFETGFLKYTPAISVGRYHERKNIGVVLDIYNSRLKLSNTFYRKIYQNDLIDFYANCNWDQYLYDSNDKQYYLGSSYTFNMGQRESLHSALVFKESSSFGYSPFYFDELSTREKRINNILSYKPQSNLLFEVEDGYDFLVNKRDIERFRGRYQIDKTKYAFVSSAYDYENSTWHNLISNIVYKEDPYKYLIMQLSYSLQRGDVDSSRIQISYSAGEEEKWIAQTEFLWNSYKKQYTIPKLEIIRELDCVEFKYVYTDANKEHLFMFKVKAFPEEKIGFSSDQNGIEFRGLKQKNIER